MLAHLNGLDSGPKSQFMNIGNWEKKIISSLGNRMMIEFRSDDSLELSGFSASINYHSLQSEDCNSWLNMNEGNLKTPDYPNAYHNVISDICTAKKFTGKIIAATYPKQKEFLKSC